MGLHTRGAKRGKARITVAFGQPAAVGTNHKRDVGEARLFQAKGLKATPAQLGETRTIVGREPRKFSDYVRESVAAWKG